MGFSQISGPILLVLGFGFVIFWHELGHFLAAKWVGIKVEQFAVGFGKAIFAWRKGLGFRLGSTRPDYEKRIVEHIHKGPVDAVQFKEKVGAITPQEEKRAADELGISETEYRLNWIPLGGYVKMLGQDDLDPNAQSADPRSFNRKSIGARMLVVSAGVLMNVLLAMIGFAIVFRAGFDTEPAVVGDVLSGSPAQMAGLVPGDRIAEVNGSYQYTFLKFATSVILAGRGNELNMLIQKPDGNYIKKDITPQMATNLAQGKGMLELGVAQPKELVGLKDTPDVREEFAKTQQNSKDVLQLRPEERVVAINGQPLEHGKTAAEEFDAKRRNNLLFEKTLQGSAGKPIQLTVTAPGGKERPIEVQPGIVRSFDGTHFNLLGMSTRTTVQGLMDGSPAIGKVLPGDVVTEISVVSKTAPLVANPSPDELTEMIVGAAANNEKVALKVMRDGKELTIDPLLPTVKLGNGKRGLGLQLDAELLSPVVASVAKDSPADRAGLHRGDVIASFNGKPVSTWFDVKEALARMTAGETATILIQGAEKPITVPVPAETVAYANSLRYKTDLQFRPMSYPRQTNDIFKAMAWGVGETKDLLIQFYISLQRMIDGSVSATNMMGPVGIFHAGTTFAERGTTWLLWFLSMISANLAVVNFLPIPIVDGGLFTFLIIEKIKGQPISPRAQTVAQVVGLVLLGCVFLFATWQDIARMM